LWNPRLREAAATLSASGGQAARHRSEKDNVISIKK